MSGSKTALYEQYLATLKSAKQAETAGEYPQAKKLYGQASKELLEYAALLSGESREVFVRLVDKMIERAKSLPDVAESAEALQKKQEKTEDEHETLFYAATIPETTFEDVAGLADVKTVIRKRIINPRLHPQVYKELRIKPGAGILMYGPPGTGKTMIARAIANEVGAVFYDIKCSQIVQKYFGVAERNVKNLFETARSHEVAVIFMDEFEALGAKRGGNSTVMARLVPEMLAQIDGFSGTDNTLFVIAATNRPWDIDSAFLRPGRFSERLFIPLPDYDARLHILSKAFAGIDREDGIDLADFAQRTEGYNGADMTELATQAKFLVAERTLDKYRGNLAGIMLMRDDLEAALRLVPSSVHRDDLKRLADFGGSFGGQSAPTKGDKYA